MTAHRRHDISDEKWKVIEPLLPGREGMWGGIAKDNRQTKCVNRRSILDYTHRQSVARSTS